MTLTETTRPAGTARAGARAGADPFGWLPLATAALMSATIAGTVLLGRPVAFASIPVFAAGVLLLAACDPAAAVCLYIGYSAMEGMYKYLSEFSQTVYVIKPALAVAILAAWALGLRFRRARARRPPLARLVGLLALWGLAQALHPFGLGVTPGVATLLVWYAVPMTFYLLVYNCVTTSARRERVFEAIVAAATVVSAFAIVQFVLGRAWTEARLPGYNTIVATDWWTTDAYGRTLYAAFRPASTTAMGGGGGYWSHLGAIAGVGLLAAPGLALPRRGLLAACLLVNILGILVSGVRLYVVVGMAEMALWFVFSARSPRETLRVLGMAAAAAVVISAAFIGAQAISGGGLLSRYFDSVVNPVARFQSERAPNLAYIPAFAGAYPLGIGYQRGLGGGRARSDTSGPMVTNRETQFNCITVDMGLPGLALMLSVMAGFLWRGWGALRSLRRPRDRMAGGMLLALLAGFVLMGLAGPSLQGADFYWISAGILFALPAIERRESAPDGRPAS